MRSILQEASDHVPQVSDQFIAYTGDTNLAILLNRDTSPTLQSLLFTRLRQARTRGAWQFLWFEDCNADLALGPRDTMAHFPVFLHLRTTNFPGPDSITRSEQAQQRRLERKATKHGRRQCNRKLTQPSLTYAVAHARTQYGDDEAGEGDVVRQDHMNSKF